MNSFRRCIACRQLFPKMLLLQLTAKCMPYTKQIVFSLNHNPEYQGRSAYVCKTKECLEISLKARKFERSLKRKIPGDIVEALNVMLKGFS
ncbi:MAG: YlxR family protein [Cyanobacteria bacterium P01_H01_bin.74]